MKLRILALILLLSVAIAGAMAHGDKKHVMGTVSKVGADSVTVKQADAKEVEVKIVTTTVFVWHGKEADQPASLRDILVGDSVVIHATPKGDTLEAAEVRFSHAAAVAAPAAARKPKS
jgi:hypothetical protein